MKNKKIIYLLTFQIICFICNSLSTVQVNSNGNYELSDGTKYNTCEEYEIALGTNKIDGYYEKIIGNKMYCLMNLSSWGINKAYQAIAIRKDGSIDFNMTWEESKVFRGNDQEMWIGLEDLHAKCGKPQSCELLIMFTTRPSAVTALVSEYLLCSDFYIDNEANKYQNHIKQWYQSGNARLASFTYHNNRNWQTKDQGGCAVTMGGPNWYGSCADNTPFGPYNGSGYYGISVEQADGDGRSEQYDNMDYMVFAVRQFGTGQLSEIQKGKYSINPGVWLDCDYTYCKECFESSTNCIVFCNDNCDNTGCNIDNTCKECKAGYFKNSDNQCVQCNNQVCATCTDNESNCILLCNEGCKSCQGDQTCIDCNNGFYLSGNNCNRCDNKFCATCITDSTTCELSCNDNCNNDGCNLDATCKQCRDGYYKSLTYMCIECDNSICATCQNEATTCILECNEGCQSCNSDQTCIDCKDGFYQSGSACIPCNNLQCATCINDANSCVINCQDNCGSQGCNIDSTCKDCINGYYLNNDTCDICDVNVCATCKNTPNNCILNCLEGCSQCNSDQSCTGCKQGYYDSGSLVCTKCNSNCATCSGSADSCDLLCVLGCGTQGCDPLGKCINCQNGFYLDSNQECQECDYTVCAQCSNSAQQCTKQCTDGCNECNIDRSCKLGTGCKDGFFQLENGQCQKCDSTKCRTCNTSADNCIEECPKNCGNKGCNVLGVCQNCITGQFLNQLSQQCQECSSHCQECQEQADQCTKCYEVENELRLPPFCVDLNTVSFENQINSQNQNSFTADISCNGACGICENTTQLCQQCRETFILHNDRCVCSSTQEIVSQKCMDLCQEDEYRDQDTQQCMKCKYYQDLCIEICPQNTFLDTSTNTCQKQGSLDLMLIYIIAGIGIILILIGLVYNHKSKSLDFQHIYEQKSDDELQQQKVQEFQDSSVITISLKKDINLQKQEIQQESKNVPDNNISTKQLVNDQLEQYNDKSQDIQIYYTKQNQEQNQDQEQQENNIIIIQQQQESIIQENLKNEDTVQQPKRKGKKRRKTQKND